MRKLVSRAAMRLATQLITNSRFSQGEATSNAGIEAEAVRVIYHGLSDPFGKLPEFARERRVLTVGQVSRSNLLRKGMSLLSRPPPLFPTQPLY